MGEGRKPPTLTKRGVAEMLDYAKSYYIYKKAYADCLRYWRKEGEPDERAFELAKKEIANLRRNPYSEENEILSVEAFGDYLRSL